MQIAGFDSGGRQVGEGVGQVTAGTLYFQYFDLEVGATEGSAAVQGDTMLVRFIDPESGADASMTLRRQ